MIHDKKAEELEDKGLYRRAAERWSVVMRQSEDDNDREWARRRSETCLKKSRRLPAQVDSYRGLREAAIETQRRMGIEKSRTEAFRLLYGRKETTQ